MNTKTNTIIIISVIALIASLFSFTNTTKANEVCDPIVTVNGTGFETFGYYDANSGDLVWSFYGQTDVNVIETLDNPTMTLTNGEGTFEVALTVTQAENSNTWYATNESLADLYIQGDGEYNQVTTPVVLTVKLNANDSITIDNSLCEDTSPYQAITSIFTDEAPIEVITVPETYTVFLPIVVSE